MQIAINAIKRKELIEKTYAEVLYITWKRRSLWGDGILAVTLYDEKKRTM